MTKSEAAFRMSCHKLFSENRRIYFWTFTNKVPVADWQAGPVWHRFSVELCNLYGGLLRGLRVIELHRDHGIHWHCLLNKRVWVGEVRRIGARYGIGRVHVERADGKGAVDYLAKYLSKKEKPYGCRVRKWGAVGGFAAVRKVDVVVESSYHTNVKYCLGLNGGKRLSFAFVQSIMDVSRNYGVLPPSILEGAMAATFGKCSAADVFQKNLPRL